MKKFEIILYSALACGMLLISTALVIFTFSDEESQESTSEKKLTVKKITTKRKRHKRKKKGIRMKKNSDNNTETNLEKEKEIELRQEVTNIDRQLQATDDIDEKIDLLDDLNFISTPIILDIIERELSSSSQEVRLSALELLENFEGKEVFSNLRKAMEDSSPEVREAAVDIIDDIDIPKGDPEEADLLLKAINDPSEDVRDAALTALENKPPYELEIIGEEAIKSEFPEIKEAILESLADTPSVRGVEIMIEGLNDPDPEFREDILDELELITDQTFSSFDDAKKWWDQHQSEFVEEFSHYDNSDDDE
jgi:HEAT repeat protein